MKGCEEMLLMALQSAEEGQYGGSTEQARPTV